MTLNVGNDFLYQKVVYATLNIYFSKCQIKKGSKVICLPIPLNNFGHKMVTPFRILPPLK